MYYSSSLRMFQKWNQWTIEIMARPRKTEALLTTLNFGILNFIFFNVPAPWSAYTMNFQAFLYLIVLTCLMFLRPEAHTTLNFISNFHVTCFPCSRALKRILWFMRSQLRGCSRTTLLLFSHWVFFRSLTRVIEASMYILNTGLRVQAFRKKEMMWGSGPDHVCHTSWRGVWPAPTYIMYLSPWP